MFFGTQLRPLFRPDGAAKIEFAGRGSVGARPSLVFGFVAPPAAGFHTFGRVGGEQYNPARTGRILADDPTGSMIQYEEEAAGFPEGFETDRQTVVESWDYVFASSRLLLPGADGRTANAGDGAHLLPVKLEIMGRHASGSWYRVKVAYKNYRHFEASTSLAFP